MNFLLHTELQSTQVLREVTDGHNINKQMQVTLASRTAKHTQGGNKQYNPLDENLGPKALALENVLVKTILEKQ